MIFIICFLYVHVKMKTNPNSLQPAYLFVAFLVALDQNKQLIGLKGLLPADKHLDHVKDRAQGINWVTFNYVPSIIWLFDYQQHLDVILDYIAYAGLGLSCCLIVRGSANWIVMLSLWMLYHSIVNVGQRWYSFGWESQLLETGFLATFLCPVLNVSVLPKHTPTSRVVIWGYRWLIFRIMLGAGLIKIRGDKCWRDLTCMNYHYETQPVPNPVSYYMHQEPEVFHKFETLTNHFVELIAPFLLFMGRRLCIVGGVIQSMFQLILITSGNLSFLNWLTILPSLACFDDASYAFLFSNTMMQKVRDLQQEHKPERNTQLRLGCYVRRVFNVSLALGLAYLSIPVIQNLMSSRQAMNTSFDNFRLVNTYGAFGSITKKRTEVIFQGTRSNDPSDPSAEWLEYNFKCKPGNVTRRPCLISPYHYRLDWLLWFAAFQNYQYNPWLVHVAVKLLANDEGTTSLIAHNPFEGKSPPKFIRVEHYSYKFTKLGSKEAAAGIWWKRKYLKNYLPPISLKTIKPFMREMGWKLPKLRTP
ncbi:lipase maturation factor 1-like isoform X2 [Gigantopelta aegis]|uniref:lipase maturation factor 1-like isoform X2 n=1 Tax=Gigantopelta aegis TaxID=1735272 RepID=UPI001B88C0E0|nr:lipase maturation factor 1-like isoform X2 [Gigantopelta aegis]